MARFSNPQVYEFRHQLTLPNSPLEVWVEEREGVFRYKFDDPEWQFLNELFNSTEDLPESAPSRIEYWRQVLDFDEEDELEFVCRAPGAASFPRELFEQWKDEATYEYSNWKRYRDLYLLWRDQVSTLEDELSEVDPWQTEPDTQLLQLEFELSHSLPDRVRMLTRLHALGLLVPEDEDRRFEHLERLGCPRLCGWRKASLLHRHVSQFVDGMWPAGAETQLSSPVGVEWFLDGPPEQRYLDPLEHLRFGLHHHLKKAPPKTSSALVVSMGGRISGAFFYQLGPGDIAQLVRGGCPPQTSPLHSLYQHEKSDGSDRWAEISARMIRKGFPRLGGMIALQWLQDIKEHGQLWIELAVALDKVDQTKLAKTCLVRAEELGFSFHKGGELSRIWSHEGSPIVEVSKLGQHFSGWKEELRKLPDEEVTAISLSGELSSLPKIKDALTGLSLPPALQRLVSRQ